MKDHVILNYQDKPLRLFLWTIPTVGWVVSPTIYFMIYGKPLIGLLISCLVASVMRWVKKRLGEGSLAGMVYWIFPHRRHLMPVTPPSHIREFVG